jgi:hypothetical protein
MNRICGTTPENIESLRDNEVFVFGSNLAGRHGGGAAREALQWGAEPGIGEGLRGRTYALPTKDRNIETLPLSDIRRSITVFYHFVQREPSKHFLVTKIGCGLAGYQVKDVAPLFDDRFLALANVSLPREFIDEIMRRGGE